MPEPIRLELRITPDALDARPNGVTPGRTPEALTYAVLDALHRLYAEAMRKASRTPTGRSSGSR